MNYEAQKVEFNHSGESLGRAEKVAGFCPELNYFNTPCHLVTLSIPCPLAFGSIIIGNHTPWAPSSYPTWSQAGM